MKNFLKILFLFQPKIGHFPFSLLNAVYCRLKIPISQENRLVTRRFFLVTQSFSTFISSSFQHSSASAGRHSLTEPVHFTSLSLFRLVRSFHNISPIYCFLFLRVFRQKAVLTAENLFLLYRMLFFSSSNFNSFLLTLQVNFLFCLFFFYCFSYPLWESCGRY